MGRGSYGERAARRNAPARSAALRDPPRFAMPGADAIPGIGGRATEPMDPTNAPPAAAARDERTLRWTDLAWLALGSLPLLWGLGALSAWYAEERWLFVVRHMRESGDWFSLVKDGEFYGDKPYLSYWAQGVSAALLGGLDEAAARLPSAIAGIGTVLVTAWIGARTLGRRAGIGAAAILLTSFSFAMFSRLATADLWNTFFSTSAIAIHLGLRARPTLLGFLGFGL